MYALLTGRKLVSDINQVINLNGERLIVQMGNSPNSSSGGRGMISPVVVKDRALRRCGKVLLEGLRAKVCGWLSEARRGKVFEVANCGSETWPSVKILIAGFRDCDLDNTSSGWGEALSF